MRIRPCRGARTGSRPTSAIEPDTGIVTDCTLGKASGPQNHEAVIGLDLLEEEHEPVTVLGDSAYGTGEFRRELTQRR